MISTEALLNMLKEGTVRIKYGHWKSGEELVCDATTNHSIPFKQHKDNATIVVYDLVNDKWEDIRVSTISSFEPMQ